MNNPLLAALFVGLGGFVGSICRYSLSVLGQRFSVTWPTGTFAANIIGCFFIGIIATLAARGTSISPELKLALATGFCGGFTTLSSLIYETSEFLRSQEYFHAGSYVAGTFAFSLTAFYLGATMVRLIFK